MIKDTPKGLPDSALDFEREPTEAHKKKWWTHKMS